jgi:hypothetical protein
MDGAETLVSGDRGRAHDRGQRPDEAVRRDDRRERPVVFGETGNRHGLPRADPEGIRWIRDLLKSLAAEGRTVFLLSHLMSEMAVTADHLI